MLRSEMKEVAALVMGSRGAISGSFPTWIPSQRCPVNMSGMRGTTPPKSSPIRPSLAATDWVFSPKRQATGFLRVYPERDLDLAVYWVTLGIRKGPLKVHRTGNPIGAGGQERQAFWIHCRFRIGHPDVGSVECDTLGPLPTS